MPDSHADAKAPVGQEAPGGRLRIALVFSEMYPASKGGLERWFVALADELTRQGHDVSYITRPLPGDTERPGFRVYEVGPRSDLYNQAGSRQVGASIAFGVAVATFLARHRDDFDVVYVAQTPLFSVLGARAALGRRRPWVVEWIEWWSAEYWQSYTPGMVGFFGWWVQRAALAVTPVATVFAESTRRRLLEARASLRVLTMPGMVLESQLPAPLPHRGDAAQDQAPLLLFVGRLVPAKHPDAFIAATAEFARRRPVRARIIGQGPMLDELRERARSLPDVDIEVRGPVDQDELEAAYAEAAALVHPSEREGFGLVVVEACARGVPVVLVAGADNAALELLAEGVNGTVAEDRSPQALADAIQRVLDAGEPLRASSRSWFLDQQERRSVTQSARELVRAVAAMPGKR